MSTRAWNPSRPEILPETDDRALRAVHEAEHHLGAIRQHLAEQGG